jgi:ribosomal protein S18 acetylase RimI-like enzyme
LTLTGVDIRLARPEDVSALVALLTLLFSQEAEFVADPARQERGLKLILSDPSRGDILVAVTGGQIVGMVSLLPVVSTALGAPTAILEDMIVKPEFRGQGIGQSLIKAAKTHAREKGYARITLLTDGDNAAAQGFYEALGFTRSSMVQFRLQLSS